MKNKLKIIILILCNFNNLIIYCVNNNNNKEKKLYSLNNEEFKKFVTTNFSYGKKSNIDSLINKIEKEKLSADINKENSIKQEENSINFKFISDEEFDKFEKGQKEILDLLGCDYYKEYIIKNTMKNILEMVPNFIEFFREFSFENYCKDPESDENYCKKTETESEFYSSIKYGISIVREEFISNEKVMALFKNAIGTGKFYYIYEKGIIFPLEYKNRESFDKSIIYFNSDEGNKLKKEQEKLLKEYLELIY